MIGQSRLNAANQPQQIIIIPTGAFALDFDTDFSQGIAPDQVQSDMVHHGQISGAMSLTGTIVIFVEGNIQHPMKIVFNRLMDAYRLS